MYATNVSHLVDALPDGLHCQTTMVGFEPMNLKSGGRTRVVHLSNKRQQAVVYSDFRTAKRRCCSNITVNHGLARLIASIKRLLHVLGKVS